MAVVETSSALVIHGVDAEKSLLGAILIDGRNSLEQTGSLSSEHFGAEAHRIIWEAIVELAEDGLGIDLTSVNDRLNESGKMDRAGGPVYVASLIDHVPDLENVPTYAQLVRAAAARRRLARPLLNLASLERLDTPDALAAEEKALLARLDQCRAERHDLDGRPEGIVYVPPAKLWMGFDQVLEERRGVGQRYGTGLRHLDAKLDGGLYAGTFTAVQGAPGLGKTAFATQVALHMAGLGCSVAAYFGDEGNNGAFVTICQQLGVPRDGALRGDLVAVQPAVEAMQAFRFFKFIRPSHQAATLEQMVEGLVALAPNGPPRVLLIDSAQVLRLSAEKPREGQIERIHRAVHRLRELTLSNQLITLLVSRVHRGAYGKKKEEDQVDPIAAAWGGAVEWLAELILHLDGKPTREDPKVACVVAKNRVSVSGTFTVPMALEWPRKRLLELDPDEEKAEVEAHRLAALEKFKERIVKVLTGRTGITGVALEKEVGGNRASIREARVVLQGEGRLHSTKKTGKGHAELWRLGPKPEGEDRDEEAQEGALFGEEK